MKDEIQILINKHIDWLKDKTVIEQVNDQWCEITTPYLDRHNDCLQIYARKDNGGYLLTDDGYIINDLISSGCKLNSPRRQEILKTTLAGFGVKVDKEQLVIHATKDNFPLRKHNIIQAMLSVNDLFYLASPVITSLFFEDVMHWLDLSDIRYTPKVKFSGQSGFDYMFDFVIPKSRQQPERIVQTINNPRKDSAEALLYKWIDTRETRSPESKLYSFLNDANTEVSSNVIEALRNYDAVPVLWSEREAVHDVLAA
jgi:uncharacterized protein DUF1829/uncharacterized protein DUF1828